MASVVRMELTGLRELSNALKQLPANIGQNVLRGAVRAGSKVITDAVVARAPMYTGFDSRVTPGILKRSVYMKHIQDQSNELQQVFFVGVRRGKKERVRGRDAFYWTWVEFGHHVVPRVGKGGERLSVRAKAVTSGSSLVAGSSYVLPKPFFRPAYAESKEAAAQAIKDYMIKRIPIEVAKLGPR
jgi:HK97 gp10 family phage protein